MEIDIQKDVLAANAAEAAKNRDYFTASTVFVLNLMSSPGSGKTRLLCETLAELMPGVRTGVIVGDICTANDAHRLEKTGVKAVQINTDQFGGDCHLDAHLVLAAAKQLACEDLDLLVIENIGNLVCPAEFDVGEDARAVVLSVTEGEDKPLKYPLMFQVADIALLNKVDLLPYLDFDADLAEANMKKIQPGLEVIRVSGKTGQGLENWIGWLRAKTAEKTGRE
jgi:hydrogenase nickel incorporation protein HypB